MYIFIYFFIFLNNSFIEQKVRVMYKKMYKKKKKKVKKKKKKTYIYHQHFYNFSMVIPKLF